MQRPVGRRLVAAVEEARPVVRPGGAGELRPRHDVGQVRARRDVQHVPGVPVRPGLADRVGHERPVVRGPDPAQRARAVLRPRVGVDEDLTGVIGGRQHVEHALRLQPAVAAAEPAVAAPPRHPGLRVVPQGLQARADRRPLRRRVEERPRPRPLRPHERLRLLRPRVLQPAVRVRDRLAVEDVDGVVAPGRTRLRAGHRIPTLPAATVQAAPPEVRARFRRASSFRQAFPYAPPHFGPAVDFGGSSMERRFVLAVVLTLGLLAVAAPPGSAQASELLFSEYVEGSGFNKAVEHLQRHRCGHQSRHRRLHARAVQQRRGRPEPNGVSDRNRGRR